VQRVFHACRLSLTLPSLHAVAKDNNMHYALQHCNIQCALHMSLAVWWMFQCRKSLACHLGGQKQIILIM
jgi:hypothetical protein